MEVEGHDEEEKEEEDDEPSTEEVEDNDNDDELDAIESDFTSIRIDPSAPII